MLRPVSCIVLWLAAGVAFGSPGPGQQECGQVEVNPYAKGVGFREGDAFIEGDRSSIKFSSLHAPIVLRPNAMLGAADGVNSDISVGPGAWLGRGETINGKIQVCGGGRTGSLKTVNGAIQLSGTAQVEGDIETINGAIEAEAATIGGTVRGVGGDITLHGVHAAGGIRIGPARKRWLGGRHPPRIVLGPGTVVEGESGFEREVELFVHVDAKIGPVTGAVAQPFTESPPPRAD